jgi:hypothetical protein
MSVVVRGLLPREETGDSFIGPERAAAIRDYRVFGLIAINPAGCDILAAGLLIR